MVTGPSVQVADKFGDYGSVAAAFCTRAEGALVVDCFALSLWQASDRSPTDHVKVRILQDMVYGIPSYWALEPECEILMFMWSFETTSEPT